MCIEQTKRQRCGYIAIAKVLAEQGAPPPQEVKFVTSPTTLTTPSHLPSTMQVTAHVHRGQVTLTAIEAVTSAQWRAFFYRISGCPMMFQLQRSEEKGTHALKATLKDYLAF